MREDDEGCPGGHRAGDERVRQDKQACPAKILGNAGEKSGRQRIEGVHKPPIALGLVAPPVEHHPTPGDDEKASQIDHDRGTFLQDEHRDGHGEDRSGAPKGHGPGDSEALDADVEENPRQQRLERAAGHEVKGCGGADDGQGEVQCHVGPRQDGGHQVAQISRAENARCARAPTHHNGVHGPAHGGDDGDDFRAHPVSCLGYSFPSWSSRKTGFGAVVSPRGGGFLGSVQLSL